MTDEEQKAKTIDERDLWNANNECRREAWKHYAQGFHIRYQQVNLLGQAAMKAALLINGGASVAMLAFIGTAINNYSGDKLLLLKLCYSMGMFTTGVLVAAIACGVTYLTGCADARIENERGMSDDKPSKRLPKLLNLIAIFLIIAGYILFFSGSLNAYLGFTNSLSCCK